MENLGFADGFKEALETILYEAKLLKVQSICPLRDK